MEQVKILFVVETKMGNVYFDEDLARLPDGEYTPIENTLVFYDTALATPEEWDEWEESLSDDDLIIMIRKRLREKLISIARGLELH